MLKCSCLELKNADGSSHTVLSFILPLASPSRTGTANYRSSLFFSPCSRLLGVVVVEVRCCRVKGGDVAGLREKKTGRWLAVLEGVGV